MPPQGAPSHLFKAESLLHRLAQLAAAQFPTLRRLQGLVAEDGQHLLDGFANLVQRFPGAGGPRQQA